MAGKNTKNPLLTGASISFPFENFTNSALLVPVSQNEPTLIPEEIEADSFLGQEPPSGSKLHSGSVSKSQSSHSLSSGYPEPSLTPDHRTHFPSEPQLVSSIPVFTQSYTGASNPAKPTPIYADALKQQFHNTLSFETRSNDSFSQPTQVNKPENNLSQPPQNPLFISSKNPSAYTPPSIFTPAQTILNPLSPSPSVQPTQTPQSIFTPAQTTAEVINSSPTTQFTQTPPPSIFTPPQITAAVLNSSPSIQPNQTTLPSIFTPAQTILNPLGPSPSVQSTQTPHSIFTPAQPTAAIINPFPSIQPNQTTLPSIFTPAQAITSVLNPSPSAQSTHTPSPVTLSSPAFQPIFNYFSSPDQSQLSNNPSSHLFSANSSSQITNPSVPLPPQSSEANAPPPSGSSHNSYRLTNIKRPTYTRPPELSVTPMAAMPTLCPESLPAPLPATPATLFTPCNVDSLGSTSTSPTTIPTVSYRPPPPPQPQAASTPSVLPASFASLAQGTSYRPVYHHWFFKKVVEGKVLWYPFSMSDSLALEQAFTSPTISPGTRVATDGGRYDVEVLRRRRTAVYWEEDPGEVRRCSWFVKGSMDVRFIPYEENIATMLEEEYRMAATTNEWNRHVSLPDGEVIVIHSPNAIAHHTRSVSPDDWGNSPQMQHKPRVVKRGMDEFDISDGEPEKVDHLLFLVHGIGKFCDLKFRPVTEVVDDFRSVSLQLLQSHFKSAVEAGQASRVEVLPVSWHQALHNADIDSRLNNITLKSIPRLRHFTNDTLLDILFYTSPVFCETIVQAVGNELNRLYNLFLSRNPTFDGGVSLGGHSLGSLILFDMLCNQAPHNTTSTATPSPEGQDITGEEEVKTLGCMKTQKARLSRSISYLTIGTAGTGQPFISYPQLVFRPKAFFALGSPIGMFVTVRGIETLGEDFSLPTCPMFFNIFHPFDPVAYRIESLINPDFSRYSPVLIPHHKGRKRMHLELKDTLEHVGSALKQRLVESVRNTWNTVYQLAMFHRPEANEHAIEQEVNKVLENEIMQSCPNVSTRSETPDQPEPDVKMGQLNSGRRIDYVLQEAPLESFNEYLFALSSHVCYWESEDTMLMMLKEIYGTMDISPDTQVVQQILPFEVPDGGSNEQYQTLPMEGGIDPTAPPSDNVSIGPPPMRGFVRGQK